MKRNIHIKCVIFSALLVSFTGTTMAEMTVDQSQGQLNITSDIDGTVIAKVIGPDDVVVVDESYEGNSFNWSLSSGPDGAYRYDVRVIAPATNSGESDNQQIQKNETARKNDYAGGSLEVKNGQIEYKREKVQ